MKKFLILLFIVFIIIVGIFIIFIFFNKPESILTKETSLPKKINNTSCIASSLTNKIYCFGGRDGSVSYDSILEYNSTKNTFEPQSNKLLSATFAHSCVEDSISNKIYCFGGYSPSFSSAIYEFDASVNELKLKQSILPKGLGGLSCAESLSNHRIYCFGGFAGESTPGPLTESPYGKEIYRNAFIMSNQIIEYDPSADKIEIKKSVLPGGRDDSSCVYSSKTQKIYCFGGGNADSAFDQILEYEPLTDSLAIKKARLPAKIDILSCVENSNYKIYCFGGETSRADQSHVLYREILEYNPITDELVTRPITLPTAIGGFSCVKSPSTYNDILCFGGWAEKTSDLIFEYSRGNRIYEILESLKKIF